MAGAFSGTEFTGAFDGGVASSRPDQPEQVRVGLVDRSSLTSTTSGGVPISFVDVSDSISVHISDVLSQEFARVSQAGADVVVTAVSHARVSQVGVEVFVSTRDKYPAESVAPHLSEAAFVADQPFVLSASDTVSIRLSEVAEAAVTTAALVALNATDSLAIIIADTLYSEARISSAPLLALTDNASTLRISSDPLLALTDLRPPMRVSSAPLLVLGRAPEEPTFEDGVVSYPLGWLELIGSDNARRTYAEVDLCDRDAYYGGYKAPLITKFAPITRGLSDRSGQPQHMVFGAAFSDTARTFRGLLDAASTKYLTNRPVVERIISDDQRRLEGTPRVVANGYIADYSPDKSLAFHLTGSDWLRSRFTRKLESQKAWQPKIVIEDFPDCPESVVDQPAPIIYGKVRVAGEGVVANVTITPALRPASPTGLTATFVAGGALYPAGDFRNIDNGLTLFYAVSAVVDGVESNFSVASVTTSAADGHVNLAWSAYAGASEIRAYVSLRSDFMQFSQLTTSLAGSATAMTDSSGGTRTDVNALDVWSIGLRMNVIYYVWAQVSATAWTSAGSASVVFTPIMNGSRRRDMTVTWDAYAGALAYRVIRHVSFYSNWGPRFDLQFDVPAVTLGVADTNNDDSLIPGGYANAPGVTLPNADQIIPLVGAVQATFVGSEDIGGVRYKRLLIARHACARIGRIDISADMRGTDAALASAYTRVTSGFGSTWLSPDESGWPFSTRYRDINDRRYTLIYTTLEPLPSKILVDVDGVESTGAGTGSVITSIPSQYLHFMQNWLAPETVYQHGAWLTSPMFPAVSGVALIDNASFARVGTVAAQRLSGGYEGSTVFGLGESVGAYEAIARWNQSCDCDSYFNRKGQFAVSMEPSTRVAAPTVITDVISIAEAGFSITDEVTQNFSNVLPYTHTRDYTGISKRGWASLDYGEREDRDDVSIASYDQEVYAPSVPFHCLRATSDQGRATIRNVLERRLARYRDPLRVVTFTVPLSGSNFEPGDVVAVTSIEGVSNVGWSERQVRIIKHDLRITEGTVTFSAYDIEQLLSVRAVTATDSIAVGVADDLGLLSGSTQITWASDTLRASFTEVGGSDFKSSLVGRESGLRFVASESIADSVSPSTSETLTVRITEVATIVAF